METKFISETITYTGEQLKSQFAYLKHGVLGDSLVAWVGPCKIDFANMADGEDLRMQATIAGAKMVHFVAEFFHRDIFFGVSFQRLMASIVGDVIKSMSGEMLRREGDDLYQGENKFSISIAAPTAQSVMIHFAVNVTREGTPVNTCSLSDFKLDGQHFAIEVLTKVQQEFEEIVRATKKVRPLGSY